MNLAGSRPISYVTIHNRSDCCTERLAGAVVELLDNGYVVESRTLATALPIPAKQDLAFNQTYATSVRVRLPNGGYLSLAEVEVWMKVPTATVAKEDGFCWKDTYGRGVGTIPTECGAGQEKSGRRPRVLAAVPCGLFCVDEMTAALADQSTPRAL